MSIPEKAFLGSLMKAEYLLKDSMIQPEQLELTRHKELMRRMLEFTQAGKNIDLITLTTLPELESFGECPTSRSCYHMQMWRNLTGWKSLFWIPGRKGKRETS